MIRSADISVVVQGPIIDNATEKCLKSIRKKLPNAQIILSTWEGSDVSRLDYDNLILNQDPGFIMQGLNGWKNICNINRMLKSTKEGIKQASRKYILKIRTDFYIKNTHFLKYFDKFPFANKKFQIFNHKIIAYHLFSLMSEEDHKGKIMQEPFHVSDTTFFGLACDIRELFSCDLVSEPFFSKYFENHKKNLINDIFPNRSWQMSPEQYITSTLTKKNFPDIKFNNYLDYDNDLIKLSHKFIMANFIFLDTRGGICTMKHNFNSTYKQLSKNTKITMYSYKNFCRYYKSYINITNHITVIKNGKQYNAKKSDLHGINIKIKGHNNNIVIELPNSFKNCEIHMDGDNNQIYIGASKIGFRNLEILMLSNGNNRKLIFGRNCSCESLSIFHHNHNSTLEIGNNVMFARNCNIQTCDSHIIMNQGTHIPLNAVSGHVLIGDNVWFAQGSTILKNAKIPSNTIVGCNSTITKAFHTENTVIAGNPGHVVKNNIVWNRYSPNHIQYIDKFDISMRDITFVVQGAINQPWTLQCLESIRTFFPVSHIILSTWKDANVSEIAYLCDEIIYNEDPGGTPHFNNVNDSPAFNLNRQITSTKNGLRAVKTKYAVKIRSDMHITGYGFLEYFNKFNNYDNKFKLFSHRIVSFAGYAPSTQDKLRSWDFCMHDYGYFGLTKDLLKLWDIPVMTDKESFYWKNKNYKYPDVDDSYSVHIRNTVKRQPHYQYHAEQYIIIKCFEKLRSYKINFKHMFDFKQENIELFKRFLVNNFIPLYPDRLGMSLPRNMKDYTIDGYTSPLDYTYPEYISMYNEYANGGGIAVSKDIERKKWNISIRKKERSIFYRKLLHFYWLRGKK